jgi:hypothetical protein
VELDEKNNLKEADDLILNYILEDRIVDVKDYTEKLLRRPTNFYHQFLQSEFYQKYLDDPRLFITVEEAAKDLGLPPMSFALFLKHHLYRVKNIVVDDVYYISIPSFFEEMELLYSKYQTYFKSIKHLRAEHLLKRKKKLKAKEKK